MHRNTIQTLFIVLLATLCTNLVMANEEPAPARSPFSEKPLEMMSQLSGLTGEWELQTLYSADEGKNWQDMGKVLIEIGYDQRELMIYERPIKANEKGFNMVSYVTYDQYRNVFRKAAIDDVWGIMDIYSGEIVDGVLVLTNLEAGTLFPEGDCRSRGFRLTLELQGDTRTMNIDATLDEGKTWQPNFKNIYVRKQR